MDMMEIRRRALMYQAQPAPSTGLLYNWDFKVSLIDTLHSLEAVDNSNASYPLSRDSNGLHFLYKSQELVLPEVYGANRAYEVDVASFEPKGLATMHTRFIMLGNNSSNDSINATNTNAGFIWRANSNPKQWSGWWGSWDNFLTGWPDYTDKEAISGKTVRVELDSNYKMSVYIDGVLAGKSSISFHRNENVARSVRIGNRMDESSGGTFYEATITGARVYDIS